MKKILFLCAMIFMVASSAFSAASHAHIHGHVTDAETGDALPYMNVEIKGTTIGTSTDISGHYELFNIPVGDVVVELQNVGFKTVTKKLYVSDEEVIEADFALQVEVVALDGVVVSANNSVTAKVEAPSVVAVMDTRLLECTHSSNVSQGLSYQPGVRVESSCQNCATPQVRINGLDGHYTQILMDSKPIFSSLMGPDVLDLFPTAMIDRVEVIRGGGSALYGASAVGGVVNIITNDAVRNGGRLSHTMTSVGLDGTMENTTAMNASVVSSENKAGLFLFGQLKNREGFDYNGDGYSDLPLLNHKILGFRSFFKTGSYSKITLQYHGGESLKRGGDDLDLQPHEAHMTEQQHDRMNGGSLNFTSFSPDGKNKFSVFSSLQHLGRDCYDGGIGSGSDEEREDALAGYGTTKDLNWLIGSQYLHQFDSLIFMPSTLMVGVEFNRDVLEDESAISERSFSQNANIGSFYLQNEWHTSKCGILVGARLDKHSMVDRPIVSPRANFRLNPSSHIVLRANYGAGFRAPQAYDEDMHVSVVDGDRLVTRLADDLKEERSHSFSLSCDLSREFGKVDADLLLEGFYTKLKDVFAKRYLSEQDAWGNDVIERYNAFGASVYGLNIEGTLLPARWLRLDLGYTLQNSSYDEPVVWDEEAPAEKKMLRTPDSYAYFILALTPVKPLSIALSGNYTGRMLVGHAESSGTDVPMLKNTPRFFTLNAKVSYDFALYKTTVLQAFLGIKNITDSYQQDLDKGFERDSEYVYGPSTPRSLYWGLSFSF